MTCECYYCAGGAYDSQEVWQGIKECRCGHLLWHHHCDSGCDDGWIDAHEEDAINYSPGEEIRCRQCRGTGIVSWCPRCEESAIERYFAGVATACFC